MTLGATFLQFYVFCVFVAVGAVLCSVYVFASGFTSHSKVATAVFDGIFGVVAGIAVWKVNLHVNDGILREYVAIGLALGVALSLVIVKTPLDKLSSALYNLFNFTEGEQNNDQSFSQQKTIGNDGGINTANCGAVADTAGKLVAKRHAKTKDRNVAKNP